MTNTIRISPDVELQIVARERDQHRERSLIYAQLLHEAQREIAALQARIAELEALPQNPPLDGEIMESKEPSVSQKH